LKASAAASVSGVILAAGLSRRFGREKLLFPLAGRPLGRHVVEAALASRLGQVILVTRPELAGPLSGRGGRLEVVLNPRPQEGQSLSLRLGLAAVAPGASHALFLLADQPLVSPELIERFLAAAQAGAELAACRSGEGLGPPSLFSRAYFQELAGLEGDQGGRSLLQGRRERVTLIEPGEALALADVDELEDARMIARRFEEDAS